MRIGCQGERIAALLQVRSARPKPTNGGSGWFRRGWPKARLPGGWASGGLAGQHGRAVAKESLLRGVNRPGGVQG